MVITLDQVTRKKLILIKQMYQRATILSSREHNMVDRIMALVGFDLTVETVLKAAVNSLDAVKTPADSFQGLIDQADKLLGSASMKLVPEKAHIRHVHSLRNDAQHKAKYPNKSDLDDCRIYIRDFLKAFVQDVYGIDFETVSQTELIKHKQIKKHLTDAQDYFKNSDYQKASELANVGLHTALNYAGRPYVGRSFDYMFDKIMVSDKSKGQKGDPDVTKAFQKIQNTVRHLALGLDYSDKVKFNKIAGFVLFSFGGGHNVYNMKKDIGEDEAEFVLSFAIDAIIQIENRVGDLEKPFGQQH